MRIVAEVREVEGNNAYCRDCFADEYAIHSWDEAMKKAALSRGTKALKIILSHRSGGTVYLCLLHAECFAEDIMKQL